MGLYFILESETESWNLPRGKWCQTEEPHSGICYVGIDALLYNSRGVWL